MLRLCCPFLLNYSLSGKYKAFLQGIFLFMMGLVYCLLASNSRVSSEIKMIHRVESKIITSKILLFHYQREVRIFWKLFQGI